MLEKTAKITYTIEYRRVKAGAGSQARPQAHPLVDIFLSRPQLLFLWGLGRRSGARPLPDTCFRAELARRHINPLIISQSRATLSLAVCSILCAAGGWNAL